jgi:hypothetical protein
MVPSKSSDDTALAEHHAGHGLGASAAPVVVTVVPEVT